MFEGRIVAADEMVSRPAAVMGDDLVARIVADEAAKWMPMATTMAAAISASAAIRPLRVVDWYF